MPLTLQQKKEIVADLKEKLQRQKGVALVDFSELPAGELADLRQKLRENDCLFRAVKKTLLRRALSEAEIPAELDFESAIGLIMGFDDPITPAKIAYQFSKQDGRLVVLGGIWDNELKSQEEAVALAQLPSRPELTGQLIWVLKSPISGLVGTLRGTLRGLLISLSEIQKQKS